jgi:hypothetical protein
MGLLESWWHLAIGKNIRDGSRHCSFFAAA